MLAKFAVKNFRSFRDRIEIDLTRHSNYTFNSFAIKDGQHIVCSFGNNIYELYQRMTALDGSGTKVK